MKALRPKDLQILANLIMEALLQTNKIPKIALNQIQKELIKELDKANIDGTLVPNWELFIKNVDEVLKNAITI